MRRILISPRDIEESQVTIDDPHKVHYLRDVLRVRLKDRIECFDGKGGSFAGTVIAKTRNQIRIQVERSHRRAVSGMKVNLAQALLKRDLFEWVIQKATELDVGRLIPLITKHSVVRQSSDKRTERGMRWHRIAEEAARQCGRLDVPHLDEPVMFDEFAPTLAELPLVLMPTISVKTKPLKDELKGLKGIASVMVLIGPEGDFTRDEVHIAKRFGARPVSLGKLTLRSETAAVCVLAIIQHTLGRL